MKKAELTESLWREAPLTKRVIGRKRFDSLVSATIAEAPIYQICYGSTASMQAGHIAYMNERWGRRVSERRECQFGPLTWLIVGAIVNFIIWKVLEWATQSRANAVMLAGWSAESSWRTQ